MKLFTFWHNWRLGKSSSSTQTFQTGHHHQIQQGPQFLNKITAKAIFVLPVPLAMFHFNFIWFFNWLGPLWYTIWVSSLSLSHSSLLSFMHSLSLALSLTDFLFFLNAFQLFEPKPAMCERIRDERGENWNKNVNPLSILKLASSGSAQRLRSRFLLSHPGFESSDCKVKRWTQIFLWEPAVKKIFRVRGN